MDPQLADAFDYIRDLAKQLITLGTGIIALSITFTQNIVKEAPEAAMLWLKVSWLLLFASIVAGIFELSALAGALAPMEPSTPVTAVPGSARVAGGAQFLLFLGGIGTAIVYGFKALKR